MRPLVLIDLSEADVATIRERLLVLAQREGLNRVDLAALSGVTCNDVKHLLGRERRASEETLRCMIAAIPELAAGLPAIIQPRR